MADELPEVTQRFVADLADYVEPIKAAAEETQSFADKNAEASGAVAELDHELHDQAESYFALAAAIDAAGLSMDEYSASQRLAGTDANGLDATLQGLKDMLGDAGLGDSFRVTHTGLNQFRIDTQDAEDAVAAATFSEKEFRDAMLDANEASVAARTGMDAYKGSLDGLRNAIARMEMGPNVSRIVDSAIADVAGGSGNGGLLATLARLGGGAGGMGGILASSGMLGGGVAVGAAIAGIVQEVGLLVAGFTAAGGGLAAFAALAYPTLDKIKSSYEGIVSAQQKYRQAVQLEARDPTTTNLSAEKTALAELKIAWADVPKGIRPALHDLEEIKREYDRLVKSFEPTALKAFTLGLRGIKELLPDLKPLADIAGGAINGLLGQADKFFQSTGFKDWLKQFDQISGPAITAIGQGIGQVAVNFGKLVTAFPKQDVVNAIHIFFRVISDALKGVDYYAVHLAHSWDDFSKRISQAWRDISSSAKGGWGVYERVMTDLHNASLPVDRAFDTMKHAVDDFDNGIRASASLVARYTGDAVSFIGRMATDIENWFLRLDGYMVQHWDSAWNDVISFAESIPGRILHALGDLGSLLISDGEHLISGLISGIEHEIPGLTGIMHTISGIVGDIGGLFTTASHDATSALGLSPSPGRPGPGPGPAPQTIRVHVDMANTMSTPAAQAALQRHVQSAVLGFANQNAGSMLVLPGRRS